MNNKKKASPEQQQMKKHLSRTLRRKTCSLQSWNPRKLFSIIIASKWDPSDFYSLIIFKIAMLSTLNCERRRRRRTTTKTKRSRKRKRKNIAHTTQTGKIREMTRKCGQ